MTTLIECIVITAIVFAPFYSMMYGSILIMMDAVADWMKGDTDDLQR
jgi:hypothetical protein